MDIQSTIATAKDVIVAISALTAAGIAFAGLSTWNRQIRGQASYELARQILRKTYLFRNLILEYRSELRMISGLIKIKEQHSDTDFVESVALKELLDSVFNTLNNLDSSYLNIWAELKTDFLEAEVVWGINLKKDFTKLSNIQALFYYDVKFLRSIVTHIRDNSTITQDQQKELTKIVHRYDNIHDNTIRQEIEECVIEAESQLKVHLRRL